MGIQRTDHKRQRKSLTPLRLDVQADRENVYFIHPSFVLFPRTKITRSKSVHLTHLVVGQLHYQVFIAVVEEELYSNCSRTLLLSQVVKTGHTLE